MRAAFSLSGATRHGLVAVAEGLIVAGIIAALLLALSPIYAPARLISGTDQTYAAKGGNGGGGSRGGGPQVSSATLVATPDMLHAGDLFDVSGCNFDTSLGNVIIGFTGGSWGSPLDGAGCFTITGIPALSGDTLPPGTYDVTAYQYLNGRWRATGHTTVTVAP